MILKGCLYRMKIKLTYRNKASLFSVICLLFFVDFVTIEYISSPTYTLIQYILLIPILLYCFKNIKGIDKKYYFSGIVLLGIGGCIIYSSIYNGVEKFYIRAALFFACCIVLMWCILVIGQHKKKVFEFVSAGKRYLCLILFINDILMILFPSKFNNISGREIGTCLLGNKFVVAYWHLMLLFFLIISEHEQKKMNKKAIVYTIFYSGICIYLDCSTTLLAGWMFLVLIFIPPKVKNILSSTLAYYISFFASAFLLIFFQGILLWKPIQYLIVNVLHRDSSLTGRVEVYAYIFKLFSTNKWWGYGYGTDIVQKTSMWYANVQNGFWDFVIRYGLITMFFLMIYMFIAVNRCTKILVNKGDNKVVWLCYVMLYVYLFMGISEIVYGKLFLFYITLLEVMCFEHLERKKEQSI